ncbi:immunoglobulin kappa light chain-like [Erpetoichthys calabaricus]|uniref:immunoglobulin kappa light chain-like n=1 Tax=Erpetoichthys calabaricus TaxID=27687 RepID=UPI0022340530|nr:immunoglobulin kappa light chain-like [Erpetoichthys calabaricus]
MPAAFTLVTVLLLHSLGVIGQTIPRLWQPHPSVTATSGQNPKIRCQVLNDRAVHFVFSWYKQTKGSAMSFMLSVRAKNKPRYAAGISERFVPEFNTVEDSLDLTIGNFDPSDVGTYYCAIWYSSQYIFGDGTEVEYSDSIQPPRTPLLHLFPPSPQQLHTRNEATLLCVARHMRPQHVRLRWAVDGQAQDLQQQLEASEREPEGTFTSWSMLSISSDIWQRGAWVTCQADHETVDPSTPLEKSVELGLRQGDCKEEDKSGWNIQDHNMTSSMNSFSNNYAGDLAHILEIATYCYFCPLVFSILFGTVITSLIFFKSKKLRGRVKSRQASLEVAPRALSKVQK